MKLIIDIPEEDYKNIKDYPNVYNSKLHKLIAQGTPISTEGDLISRNALIQHAYSAVVDGVEKDIIDLSDVDNAPTVELDESVIQEVLNKRCMTAVANEYLIALHGKRPQGVWLHNGINVEGMDLYRCSICNRRIVTWSSSLDEFPYCHCGAKMGDME